MRKYILVIIFSIFSLNLFAQLQNASFEQWDISDPVAWSTSEFYSPGSAIQSTNAHGGVFALNLNVVLDTSGTPVVPYAYNVFGLTTMPEVLTFWVKGNLAGNNYYNPSFNLIEMDTAANVLAYGDQTFTSISNVYEYKFINILNLAGASLLGQATISFIIGANVGNTLNVNTSVFIDDLYLGPDNTALENKANNDEVIEKLYPNPANEQAFLVFNQKKYGKVSLKVYDLLGNLVQDVLNENLSDGKYKAEINTAQFSQGIYLCKLELDDAAYCVKLIKS